MNGAYHVYPTSATAGNIEGVDKNGVITLTDGTELAPSVLLAMNKTDLENTLDYIEWVLTDDVHSAPAFGFTLDTHGHYMALSDSAYQTVAYYTGAWKVEDNTEWSTDVDYIAQFVDVATGEVEEVPVTASWEAWAQEGDYYDITDELYGDATYAPHEITGNAYGDYRFLNEKRFDNDETTGDILYDVSEITFIIASGDGDDIDVQTYEGLEALIDAYDNDYPASSITLTNIAVVVSESAWGNEYAVSVFAYEDAMVTGGIVFFPNDMTAREDWDRITDSYYQYNLAYLNGAVEGQMLRVARDNVDIMDLTAGFYRYTINGRTGLATDLVKIDTYVVDESSEFRGNGSTGVWLNGTPVAEDVVIADVRTDAKGEIDNIEELADFYNNYADPDSEYDAKLVYFVENNEVVVIYVVDNVDDAWMYDVTAKMSESYTGDVTVTVSPDEIGENATEVTVTLTKLSNGVASNWVSEFQKVTYTVNGVEHSIVLDVNTSEYTAGFPLTVDGTTEIVIVDVVGQDNAE